MKRAERMARKAGRGCGCFLKLLIIAMALYGLWTLFGGALAFGMIAE
jgi:hypothetical protein